MDKIAHILFDYFKSIGLPESSSRYLKMIALLLILLIIIFIIDIVLRKILIYISYRFANRTKTNFDDLLVENKMPRNIAHLIPLLVSIEYVHMVFIDFPFAEKIILKGLYVFSIVLTLWIIRSFLNTLRGYFKTLKRLKDKPIDSFIQVFMITFWVIGSMAAFAIITNIEFIKFITTLGAGGAVMLLIFKDTMLGVVASIQVSANDMLRIGDWITIEKYGADGNVIEINLATVKVQNFDKTITTIPTYSLISDSFKNWRGMTDSGGRRIKRSLNIKLNSVKYLTDDEVEQLKKIELISTYLDTRYKDVKLYNTNSKHNKELAINGRNLTNIGVFRKYVDSYVTNHSAINEDMILMIRQLAPTSQGIPIEVYAFSSDKRWENYEYIMADIFDHLIAAVPYFDLEIFELPNNSNFSEIAQDSN